MRVQTDAKKKAVDRLVFERKLWNSGVQTVCGVDEVGRGCLAGPVMACAVIFEKNYFHPDVNDSKLVTPQKREELRKILCENAVAWSVGQASAEEIDTYNIRQATFLAMRRAMYALGVQADYLLVDGEKLGHVPVVSRGIVKGDQKSFTIAAASIIAKQVRDSYMIQLSETLPWYMFEQNKGYGTQAHLQAIARYGLSAYHRRTFTKKYSNQNK